MENSEKPREASVTYISSDPKKVEKGLHSHGVVDLTGLNDEQIVARVERILVEGFVSSRDTGFYGIPPSRILEVRVK